MDYKKFRQAKAIEAKNKQKWLELNPELDDKSGIYVLRRTDENGFKYAYVGLATKSVLSRCAEHLRGFDQHIDKSIKKHKLYSKENPFGWKLDILCFCPAEECNEKEQFYIKKVHQSGRQLLNVTGGSQGKGKFNISENRATKGYLQGLANGYMNARKDIAHLFKLHLDYTAKRNPPTVNQKKALQKFADFLDWENKE